MTYVTIHKIALQYSIDSMNCLQFNILFSTHYRRYYRELTFDTSCVYVKQKIRWKSWKGFKKKKENDRGNLSAEYIYEGIK